MIWGVIMRKQYYFQPSKNGFNAWDVDKLIKATKNFPQIIVKLDDIQELDENFWYQSPDTIPTCRSVAEHMKLVNEATLEYPIILSKDWKVMDGMHRVVKSLFLGKKK